MSDQWAETTLGDILTRVKRAEPVLEGGVYPAVSVTKDGQGLGDKEAFIGGKTNYARLFRVQQGDVVVRTITAFESPVGVARAEHSGSFVSQVFLTYEVLPAALPEYLALFFQTPGFWSEMQNRAQGTVLRRKTISDDAFRGIPISLPPLAVQRRIVDLMAHLDNHLANLRAERETLKRLLDSAALSILSLPHPDGALGIDNVLTRNIGGTWGAEPEVEECTVGVYRSTEFTNLGYLSGPPDAIRSVPSSHLESRRLEAGDILVEKSGGTPTRPVGRVVRVTADDLHGETVGANFLQLLRVDPRQASPDYVFWVLWTTHRRGDAADFQQASTNIRNLKTKDYLAQRVDFPALSDQRRAAATLDAVLAGVVSLDAEEKAVQGLRGALLAGLLAGSTKVPDSYDSLLDSVA